MCVFSLQVGIDSFQCVCDTSKICTKKSFTANYKETYATSADDESPSENVGILIKLMFRFLGESSILTVAFVLDQIDLIR